MDNYKSKYANLRNTRLTGWRLIEDPVEQHGHAFQLWTEFSSHLAAAICGLIGGRLQLLPNTTAIDTSKAAKNI